MKALTNKQKLALVLADLGQWVNGGDDDSSMSYAYNHGFDLHAASLWLSTGAASEGIPTDVKIPRKREMTEIRQLCKQAHIYICPSCNHHAFLDSDEGPQIRCSSCLKTAVKELKRETAG